MILAEYRGDISLPCVAYPDNIRFPAWYNALRTKLIAMQDGVIPLENGYRFLFTGQAEPRAFSDQANEDKLGEDLKAYARLEADRCPFLHIRVEYQGGNYALILTGGDDVRGWLAEDYSLAK